MSYYVSSVYLSSSLSADKYLARKIECSHQPTKIIGLDHLYLASYKFSTEHYPENHFENI